MSEDGIPVDRFSQGIEHLAQHGPRQCVVLTSGVKWTGCGGLLVGPSGPLVFVLRVGEEAIPRLIPINSVLWYQQIREEG